MTQDLQVTLPESPPEGSHWFAFGACLGGAVGLVLGLLTAPRPGAATRQALAEQSATWREKLTELAEAELEAAPEARPGS